MLSIILGFLAGLGIFLYGTHLLGNGLQSIGASKMRQSLAVMTNTKLKAIISGLVVTFFLQSSTVTNILVVGLVGESVLTLVQAFSVVLGAAVGTTLTVQILTFDVAQYSAIFIIIGTIFIMFIKRTIFKTIGQILLSVGFIFFGIGVITSSLEPLSESQEVLDFLINLAEQPVLLFIIGIIFTALMHSSAAMIIIGIAFVTSGVLSLPAVIPLVLGANVGDTLPVLVSSLAYQIEGKKLAIFNFLFKTVGAVVVLILLPLITDWILFLPGAPERQVAHFHTLLNIFVVLLFLPLLPIVTRFLNTLLPKKKEQEIIGFQVKLNDDLLSVPEEALIRSKKEIGKLAYMVQDDMINQLKGYITGDVKREMLEAVERDIDAAYISIQKYLLKLGQKNLTSDQSNEEVKLLNILNDIEHIGDVVIRFIKEAEKISVKNIELSPEDKKQLLRLLTYIEKSYDDSVVAFINNNKSVARRNIQYQSGINQFEQDVKFEHYNLLITRREHNPIISSVYLDIINQLIFVYHHSQNISRTVLGLV